MHPHKQSDKYEANVWQKMDYFTVVRLKASWCALISPFNLFLNLKIKSDR